MPEIPTNWFDFKVTQMLNEVLVIAVARITAIDLDLLLDHLPNSFRGTINGGEPNFDRYNDTCIKNVHDLNPWKYCTEPKQKKSTKLKLRKSTKPT